MNKAPSDSNSKEGISPKSKFNRKEEEEDDLKQILLLNDTPKIKETQEPETQQFIRYSARTNSQKPLFFDPPPSFIPSIKRSKSFKQKTEEAYTVNNKLKFLLFISAGMISLYPKYIMMAESALMEEIFPREEYSFYILIPTYLAIPPSMWIIKLLSKTKMTVTTKLVISLILALILFLGCPYYALKEKELYSEEYETSEWNFYLMLLSFFLMYIFCIIYQSYFTAVMSVYHPKWTNCYFIAMAGGNLFLMAQKTFAFYFNLSVFQDFFFIWGVYCVLVLFVIFLLLKISRTGFYKDNFHIFDNETIFKEGEEIPEGYQKEDRRRKVNYQQCWKVIKGDAIGILITMMLCFTIFPGMVFSSLPVSVMSAEKYILILNIIAAVFDFIMRPVAVKSYARALVMSSFYIGAIVALVTVYFFMVDFQVENEGVIYLNFVIVAFILSRTSVAINYFMINSNKKANNETMEGIASIMTNMTQFGVCFGNVLSNLFLLVKDEFFLKDI